MKRSKNLATTIAVTLLILLVNLIYPVTSDEVENQNIVISSGVTIIVPDDYPTIQDAIDNASLDDCIFVKIGTYRETITIVINNLTLQGEDKNHTVIEGTGYSDIISIINVNFTKITGFTISGSVGWSGITLTNSSLNEIGNNIIRNCSEDGIDLYQSHRNTIQKNNITNCSEIGIDIDFSECNVIKNNEISNTNWIGMAISDSNGNKIQNNIISTSRNYGIDMVSSNNNILSENVIEHSLLNGLMIWECNENSFLNNTIQYNEEDGLWIYYSNNNTIRFNFFNRNKWNGIDIVHSQYNQIKENIIYDGIDNGIGSYYSSYNQIMNNTFLSNGIGIYLYVSTFNSICFNNFIDSGLAYGHAVFASSTIHNSIQNIWHKNYWDDWIGLRFKFGIKSRLLSKFPKCIRGEVGIFAIAPPGYRSIKWYNFDWNPVSQPYEYDDSGVV